jgi:two-component system, NarL family, invasion response regulator UvrY
VIRVWIADDHQVVRRGIRQILEETSDIVVAGEAGSKAEVLNAIREHDFDILLLDIGMPGGGGLEILEQAHQLKPDLRVLILTMYSEEQFALRALRLHAFGYLTKESAPEELVAAIQAVARGEKYITRALADVLVADLERETKAPHESLSAREFQILRMLAVGKDVAEISRQLSLSIKTIYTYRGRILTKLGLKNTAQLIRYGIEHNLTE